MKVIDLSHEITRSMTVYSEKERPNFNKVSSIEEAGYNETNINIYSHNGTHMDSPYHIFKEGKKLSEFPVENFLGNAFILDVTKNKENEITLEFLKLYQEEIKKSEFLILKTGWEKYWNNEKYFNDFPVLSEEAALWLSMLNIKGIGVDTISVDKVHSKDFNIHKILLSKEKIIIENLTNLNNLYGKFMFIATPLNFKESDGCPVRAIGIFK